ncbi:uncharacterized protein LOC106152439 isoform X4 [Lingula anatina]|uniref:Uncharacterized protein LOC106152439 isoform X4 n=1 Tax=Lingula anatina TaxID=7574 RepID=A0A1S3H654_LINAN|nr:uncharacterized protein LOC106152439 isoform X4 [Lingula anatina]|eukprot:XP_013381467.1 uncharacterized protein LOC106152439 isoform X4 [Lingula anatina]
MLAYTSGADSMLTYPERTSHSDTASLAQTAPHMPHTVHSLPAPPGLIHSSNPRSYPSLPPLPPPRTRDCRDLSVRASSLLNNRSDSNVPYRLRGTRSPPPRYNNRLEALYLLQKGQVCNQGRLMMTSTVPSSQSELQLYRVLQRANLLQYFDIFIAQGGDDVQQLCEAGEEEFLEIMALVGMASKPLHVRRLQKALQDWVANPALFQQPHTGSSPTSGGSAQPSPLTTSVRSGLSAIYPSSSGPNVVTAPTWNPQPARPTNSLSPSPSGGGAGLSPVLNLREDSNHQDDADLKRNSDSPIPTPVLVESQIAAIAEAAEKLVPTLPQFEPKPMNMRKQINKEIEKPSPRRHWNEETMEVACDSIAAGKLSIRKASEAYGIPRDAIQRRIAGRLPPSCRPGPRTILMPEEEMQIVEYCFQKRASGKTVTGMDCRRMAYRLAEDSGRSHPFSNGIAGADWFEGFKNRHPELPYGKHNANRTGTTKTSRTILSMEEEQLIVEYMQQSREQGKGVSGLDVRRKAYEIADASGRSHPFRNGIAGYDWFEGFRTRHPEVTFRKSATVKPLKVQMASTDSGDGYPVKVDDYVVEVNEDYCHDDTQDSTNDSNIANNTNEHDSADNDSSHDSNNDSYDVADTTSGATASAVMAGSDDTIAAADDA